LLLGSVQRAYFPGCELQRIVTLIGEENTGKTNRQAQENPSYFHVKESPPEAGSIIPANEAEEKLARKRKQRALRQLFSFLYEDMAKKKLLVKVIQPKITIEMERRKLMLEKIRRLEASIAQREREASK
jgi:hypothetical protein